MKCPYCNAEIEDGAKFCTNCGKALTSSETVPETAEADTEKLPDEPPKKQMEKLIRILVIAAAVLVTAALGITLGVSSFVNRQYKAGQEAYEAGDYETSIEHLKNSFRFGKKEDSGILLADSYAKLGRFEESYQVYTKIEDLISSKEDIKARYGDVCGQIAYSYLSTNDTEGAMVYLQKQYELTQDETINNRIKAIQNGGTYADETGNIYNLDGKIETAVCADEKGNEIYRADLVYDHNGNWKFAKAYSSAGTKRSVFGTFEWNPDTEYELTVYSSGDSWSWIARGTEKENDEIRKITALSEVSKQIMSFSRTYNSEGFVTKETIETGSGDIAEIEWPAEENPEHAVLTIGDETYIAGLTYNSAGQIETLNITRNFLQTVMRITNEYNDDGTVKETVTKISCMPLVPWMPHLNYRRTITSYSAHRPVTRTVLDENGKLIARGYYISGCGWLMMYLPD